MRDLATFRVSRSQLDGAERPYLDEVFHRPDDVGAREAYARLLEALDTADGRARARALRLQLSLAASPAPDVERALRAELRVLLTEIRSDWQAVVFRLDIRNCGVPGPAADRRVRFDFRCPRVWETLRPTDDPVVRGCDACARPVHHCHTVEEADERARRGECIAVDPALTTEAERADEPLSGVMVGRLALDEDDSPWAERLFGSR